MAGIYPGSAITRNVEETPDVCIVGSGAGGSVLAAGLCQKGLKVVMLEEGGYHTRADFNMQEERSLPNLYQEQGMRATEDAAFTILQGRTVGGGTVVNWTTSFRTPKATLDRWASAHGVEGIDEAALMPHWLAAEERLNIHPQPEEEVNANNGVLWRGGKALGIEVGLIRRNIRGCMNSGYCGMGCPVDGKQSMILTYLPDAVKAGLTLYANCRAEHITSHGRRAVSVIANVLDETTHQVTGRKVLVKPKVLVLSGGAINSPALLLRSDLNPNGRAGLRTFLHPVVATAGLFDERIEGFYGAPQSVHSHHFIERGEGKMGFFLEAAPVDPVLAAGAFSGFGVVHQELMTQLPHINTLISLSRDGFLAGDEGGTVRVRRDGRPAIRYLVSAALQESFREGCKTMAKIQFAAGARKVLTLAGLSLNGPAEIGKLDGVSFEALQMPMFTAHQMGGCAMGKDPDQSVVGSNFRHHHMDNLFVVDGSVFPTSLGVNPQESIYGIAGLATHFVAEAV